MKPDAVTIREATERDRAFVLNSWLKCYRFYSNWGRSMSSDLFYRQHHAVLERLMARPSIVSLVCSLEGDDDTLLGYLIAEDANQPVFHFVYVKAAFRDYGIAGRLLTASGINPAAAAYTHRTKASRWIDDKFPGLLYNPYLSFT